MFINLFSYSLCLNPINQNHLLIILNYINKLIVNIYTMYEKCEFIFKIHHSKFNNFNYKFNIKIIKNFLLKNYKVLHNFFLII